MTILSASVTMMPDETNARNWQRSWKINLWRGNSPRRQQVTKREDGCKSGYIKDGVRRHVGSVVQLKAN